MHNTLPKVIISKYIIIEECQRKRLTVFYNYFFLNFFNLHFNTSVQKPSYYKILNQFFKTKRVKILFNSLFFILLRNQVLNKTSYIVILKAIF